VRLTELVLLSSDWHSIKIIIIAKIMAADIGQVSAKTRAAEGFFNGLKFSIVHALTYAPFYSKQASLDSGRSFWLEYSIKASRACFFYTGILSATFGMRHLVAENKELLRFDLQYNVPAL